MKQFLNLLCESAAILLFLGLVETTQATAGSKPGHGVVSWKSESWLGSPNVASVASATFSAVEQTTKESSKPTNAISIAGLSLGVESTSLGTAANKFTGLVGMLASFVTNVTLDDDARKGTQTIIKKHHENSVFESSGAVEGTTPPAYGNTNATHEAAYQELGLD